MVTPPQGATKTTGETVRVWEKFSAVEAGSTGMGAPAKRERRGSWDGQTAMVITPWRSRKAVEDAALRQKMLALLYYQ
jgi:hypothetical protein